jgi:hypothetical protein
VDGAGTKNGNIRTIARQHRKGGAAGKQALFLIPLTPEQNEFNVCAIAEVLGDIQRVVMTFSGP